MFQRESNGGPSTRAFERKYREKKKISRDGEGMQSGRKVPEFDVNVLEVMSPQRAKELLR
jgi:hypothetical protein